MSELENREIENISREFVDYKPRTEIMEEIPPIQEVLRSFDTFKLLCPWFAERIDLGICSKCRFFGGFVRIRAIQFRTEHGYRYVAFPMPPTLAEGGSWKQLPNVRIVHIPSNVICNFPQRIPLTPEWRDGFNPDPSEELQRMHGRVE